MPNRYSTLIITLGLAALLFFPVTAIAQNKPAGEAGKAPADFPADIPVYKNATLSHSGPLYGDPKLGQEYHFDTNDAVETVKAFYLRQLPANGWTVTKGFGANPNTITVMKGKRMAMVSPNRVAGGKGELTRIAVELMATK